MGSRMLGNDVGTVAKSVYTEPDQSQETSARAVDDLFLAPTGTKASQSSDGGAASLDRPHSTISTKVNPSGANVRFRYRERVRQFAEKWPQAELLVSYLDQDWSQRDARLRAAFTTFVVSDVLDSGETNTVEIGCSDIKNERDIQEALTGTVDHAQLRLVVVPDISPVVVGLLGDAFDINPLVFVAALQDLWSNSDFEPEAVSRLSLDRNFGASLFSYDCETEFRSSLTFFSRELPFDELQTRLSSPQVTKLVDAAVIEQDCKDKFGSRALLPFPPVLCPPVRKSSPGIAELWRSYQGLNRLTVFQIKNSEVPIILMLTTSSNYWCEHDRHLYEAARFQHDLPSWVNRLMARIEQQIRASIINIQTRDAGNPFFSRFFGYRTLASRWWQNVASQTSTTEGWESLGAYYTRDLLPILNKCRHSSIEPMFAMDVWATERAMEAFEETLSCARTRLDWFKANTELYKSTPISGRIEILRDHRNILVSSKERIESHIQKFQVSALKTMQHSKVLRTQYGTEVKTLLFRLQETRTAMHAVLQTNEQLIQDCLFDLQLELSNTQLLESRHSIEQNAVVKRLTALAFVFIPISTVASIFGMNVRGLVGVDFWVFLAAVASVLGLSLLVAGYRSVKALLSAVEAVAFQHAAVGNPKPLWEEGHISTAKRRPSRSLHQELARLSKWVLAMSARICVFLFAICSLLFLPIESAYYLVKQGIEFGVRQETVHSERRLKVVAAWVRDMVRSSSKSWLEGSRDTPWWKRVCWRIAFVPALMYAYLAHHMNPQT